jgi:hypothetical protein
MKFISVTIMVVVGYFKGQHFSQNGLFLFINFLTQITYFLQTPTKLNKEERKRKGNETGTFVGDANRNPLKVFAL